MRLLFLIILSLPAILVSGQETASASFRKYPVESSGCFVYLPSAPGEWKLDKSEDGSDVYTLSQEFEGYSFDVIAVKFGNPFSGASHEELEDLLISYLDYLKSQFGVTESLRYGKGQQLPGNESAIGVLDFWKAPDESQSKVKGWITEFHLAVLLVSGNSDPSEKETTDLFLNGFRFP
jgi:hypothetical protein